MKVAVDSICYFECPTPPAQAHSTFTVYLPSDGRGLFLYVDRPGNAEVSFQLRLQDVSRQAETWGTSLPVVRERDTFSGTLELLNVPTDARFRSTLRVYDFAVRFKSQVTVRFYNMDSDELLLQLPLTLATHEASLAPQALLIDLPLAYPELASAENLRITIDPATPGMQFWAFVSVTNNATQHVTMVLPDNPR
ncbi:MAG: hypothetical protein WBX15_16015 [Thermoanaerobaculia bacterium]